MNYNYPIKLLQFTNPVFNNGFNLTVRRGTKWHGVRECRVQLGGDHTVFVNRMHTQVFTFNTLEDFDLRYEHDPVCRTVTGLSKVMKEVYPEFEETDEVTLVTFILDLRKPQIEDEIYVPDMVPAYVGKIQNVIELNDGFWEINYMGVYNDTKNNTQLEKWGQFIVHESQYRYNIDGDNHNGWFNGT